MIAHSEHTDEDYDPKFTASDWDNKTKHDASSLLAAITDFDFIITFQTVYQLLSPLDGISHKLQRRSLDILEAHRMVRLLKSKCDNN